MLPSVSNKTELFAEIFSLSTFPTRTNLKYLCKSQVAYEGLDFSKTPGLDLSGSSEELWAWMFLHISWSSCYVSEGKQFSRFLKSFICSQWV